MTDGKNQPIISTFISIFDIVKKTTFLETVTLTFAEALWIFCEPLSCSLYKPFLLSHGALENFDTLKQRHDIDTFSEFLITKLF